MEGSSRRFVRDRATGRIGIVVAATEVPTTDDRGERLAGSLPEVCGSVVAWGVEWLDGSVAVFPVSGTNWRLPAPHDDWSGHVPLRLPLVEIDERAHAEPGFVAWSGIPARLELVPL